MGHNVDKEHIDEALLSMPVSERHALIPASYLVLKRGNEVLLARRFHTGYEDGKYSVPAGHVEAGETFADALAREVGEEVGITFDMRQVRLAHMMQRKSADSERIEAFFVVEVWEGKIVNREPEKCDDLDWFSLNQLPENTIPYIRQALTYIQFGVFYSEFGFEKNI
jgi:8-oxo-dGTP diphosphatase